MPFRNYDFTPERIAAMRAAFERACGILHLNGNTEDPLSELIVLKIAELAKVGEIDSERLCIGVLAEFWGDRPTDDICRFSDTELRPHPARAHTAGRQRTRRGRIAGGLGTSGRRAN
jgi:hypothetical protein